MAAMMTMIRVNQCSMLYSFALVLIYPLVLNVDLCETQCIFYYVSYTDRQEVKT